MVSEPARGINVSARSVPIRGGKGGNPVELSFTVMRAVSPCVLSVSASGPSVRLSASKGIWMVATPSEFSVATPTSEPPLTSFELIPAMV